MSDKSDAWLYWYWGKESQPQSQVSALVELFRRESVSDVLDLGCGTGRHSLFLAKEGFKVTGFDRSSSAIKRAAELSEKEKLDIDFRVWDMIEFPYPFKNQTFDAVIATKVIHHTKLENILKIASEISRMLKEGGILFVEVPARSKACRLESEGQRQEMIEEGTFLPLNGEEEGIPHHYFTQEELLSIFKDYEILNLEIQNEHYCMTAKHR
jgi:SAM-dependent methyltransferase